jgi:hypothetical protein
VATMGFTEGVKVYTFIMVPTTDYVSSQDFDMWMWRFMFEFMPRIIDEKKKHKYTKGLKQLEKMYNKIRKVLGEEGYEFFRTNVDYEEYHKRRSSLQKAMLEATPKWAQYLIRKYL